MKLPPKVNDDDTASTQSLILDDAINILQRSGYARLNYRELAEHAGVTQAAIHYYFGRKEDLVRTAIERYGALVGEQLNRVLEAESTQRKKTSLPRWLDRVIWRYVEFYSRLIPPGALGMCPVGTIAAESGNIPLSVRTAVAAFFEMNVAWLCSVVAAGLYPSGGKWEGNASDADADAARRASFCLVAALEGGLLLARALDDGEVFKTIAASAVRGFLGEVTVVPRGV